MVNGNRTMTSKNLSLHTTLRSHPQNHLLFRIFFFFQKNSIKNKSVSQSIMLQGKIHIKRQAGDRVISGHLSWLRTLSASQDRLTSLRVTASLSLVFLIFHVCPWLFLQVIGFLQRGLLPRSTPSPGFTSTPLQNGQRGAPVGMHCPAQGVTWHTPCN